MNEDARSRSARAEKARLRSQVRDRIRAMSADHRCEADRSVCRLLSTTASAIGARFVLGYLALADEVDIAHFLTATAAEDRQVWLPRVVSGELRYGPWRPGDLLSPDEEGVPGPVAAGFTGLPASGPR